jgi:hypothetical protein
MFLEAFKSDLAVETRRFRQRGQLAYLAPVKVQCLLTHLGYYLVIVLGRFFPLIATEGDLGILSDLIDLALGISDSYDRFLLFSHLFHRRF